MEADRWPPLDERSDAAAVARALDDIEQRGEVECNQLLDDLLLAAWNTLTAQNQ